MVPRRVFARLIGISTAILALMGLVVPTSMATAATKTGTIAIAPLSATIAPSGTVTVLIRLHNVGPSQVPAGTIRLSSDPSPINSDEAVTSWLAKKSGGALPGNGLGSMPSPALEANATVNTTFSFAAAKLTGPQSWGVRGIAASLEVGSKTLDFARTTLVLTAGPAPAQIRLGTILPLATAPSALGLATKDDLAASTSAVGYLTAALALADKHAVTLAVDPRLTTSITTLGPEAPPSARKWLDGLNAAPRDGFWLAYADSDLTGQLQAGAAAPVVPSLADLPNISNETTWPGWTPSITDVAWPRANSIASGNIATLAEANYRRLIASSENLATTSARATVDGMATVVTSNGTSQCWSSAEMATDQFAYLSGIACATSYLGATATSSASHTVIAALSRVLPSESAFASLQSTYSALVNLSWVDPITVGEVFSSSGETATLVSKTESAARLALIKKRLANQDKIVSYSEVATDPAKIINPGARRLASVVTNGWPTQQSMLVGASVNDGLTLDVLNSVSIVASSTINMVGGQARIPVVIRNDLPSAVVVTLRAEPSNARLIVDRSIRVTVEENSQSRAYIPVTARVGSGSVDLEVSLVSEAGRPVGAVHTIPVRVRADWEAWGLVGIGVVFVTLVVAGVIRTVRKRKVSS